MSGLTWETNTLADLGTSYSDIKELDLLDAELDETESLLVVKELMELLGESRPLWRTASGSGRGMSYVSPTDWGEKREGKMWNSFV